MATEQAQITLSATNDATQDGDEKCVFVIFNPVSGKTDPEQRKKHISDALAEQGYRCQYIETSEQEGAKALAEKALRDGVDLLAVSGGDGTVMEVLSALVGSDTPVAVFPAGTGNLLSVNLGIPMTVPEAVNVALSGKPYHLDLAKTGEGRHFAILGGIGLDARMIRDADRETKNKMGVLAYLLAAIKNLPKQRTYVQITLDDQPPFRKRAKSVLVANMGKITGGLQAIPTASPHDGVLDVAILKAETLGQWLRLLGYALLGRTHEAPDMDVYQAKSVVLETASSQPVEFDGEDGGRITRLHVEIVPQAVKILLPESSPATPDASITPVETARRSLLPLLLVITAFALLGTALWRRRNQ